MPNPTPEKCHLCGADLVESYEFELATCEDCLDDVESKPLEDQLEILLNGRESDDL